MTDAADFVAGVRLTHINVTSTHTVEFWEVQPGNVLTVQNFDEAKGDVRLDIGPQLLEAGGTFTELCKRLTSDVGACSSAALREADEHRARLPIRDASLPPPQAVPPPFPPGTYEATTASRSNEPGGLRVLDLPNPASPYNYSSWSSDYCYGTDGIDGSWCPPGTSTAIRGNSYETMYWDAEAYNPQPAGATSDEFTVLQQIAGVWQPPIYHLWLTHGKTVEVTFVGTAATYQANLTGNSCSFAERWRRAFPSITGAGTNPGGGSGPVVSGFSNDIQGLTHDTYNWILSRSEYGISGPQYGVLGEVAWNEDLNHYSPPRNEYQEPQSWINQGFNHFGDIVHDEVTEEVFISLSGTSGGGIGRWAFSYEDAVKVSDDELSWLARNPVNRQFYASKGFAPAIQRYSLTDRLPTVATVLPPINLINLPVGVIDGIQGGKVSSHGKLWVVSLSHEVQAQGSGGPVTGCCSLNIWGIDPYSGIVQIEFSPLVDINVLGALWSDINPATSIEAEGLDITDPRVGHDMLPDWYIGGAIHVQVLQNMAFPNNDGWVMMNFNVSDLDRL